VCLKECAGSPLSANNIIPINPRGNCPRGNPRSIWLGSALHVPHASIQSGKMRGGPSRPRYNLPLILPESAITPSIALPARVARQHLPAPRRNRRAVLRLNPIRSAHRDPFCLAAVAQLKVATHCVTSTWQCPNRLHRTVGGAVCREYPQPRPVQATASSKPSTCTSLAPRRLASQGEPSRCQPHDFHTMLHPVAAGCGSIGTPAQRRIGSAFTVLRRASSRLADQERDCAAAGTRHFATIRQLLPILATPCRPPIPAHRDGGWQWDRPLSQRGHPAVIPGTRPGSITFAAMRPRLAMAKSHGNLRAAPQSPPNQQSS
jgi:hypothetical protein